MRRKGRPVGFVLTPGQTRDNQDFLKLLRMIANLIRAMIAGKGWENYAICEELNVNGFETVVTPKVKSV